jgi:cobalt-zinc-cadmium efflux system membrane fusion protein
MKRQLLQIIGAVLILGGFCGAFLGWGRQPHAHAEASGENERPQIEQEQAEDALVCLADKTVREFGIETAPAGPGRLSLHLTLPGEVAMNADRLAHIVPRVPGVAGEVYRNLGDCVKAGDVLAVIESRDLADLKAGYLAMRERVGLAEASFTREQTLWQQKITSEQEYLHAKRDLAEAKIELQAAEQKLHAVGFTEEYLAELPGLPHESFTRHRIVAPIDGTIIAKHIVLGEVLQGDRECFIIADLSTVWVDLNVYQSDLTRVRTGQKALISAGPGLQAEGTISFVSSLLCDQTRTMLARVVLPNPDGQWRAGLYVTGEVLVEEAEAAVLIPAEALVRLDGRQAVFVKTEQGFRAQAVATGRSEGSGIEILSGLAPGQEYVTSGAFLLKSELKKPTAEE